MGNTSQYITAADVNGDGKMDLITVSAAGSSFYVLTNDGTGGFVLSSSPPASSTANTVLAEDVNGDGKPDLITADYYGDDFIILTNDGHGGFVLSSSPSTGMYPIGITAADINGDGKLELISANSAQQDSTVSILTNNGTGGFATSGKFAVGSNPWSVCAADVNGDGKLDLITANYGANTVSVLTNNGSGGFATSGTYPVGVNPRNAITVDVNGDGSPDIISANYNDNTISILTNNGIGMFATAAVYPVGSNPDFLAAADVNGDGAVDLMVANYGASTVLVLTNNGSGGFVAAGTFAVGAGPRAVVAVDVNGDGKVDLCTAGDGTGTVTVLTNGTPFLPTSPTITSQPNGQTNIVGNTATFAVRAVGSSPLFYQWRFDGTNLPAATNGTLILTNLSLSQSGNYDVVVTNYAGSVTSTPATLNVLFIVVKVNGQIVTSTNTTVSPATITLLGGYYGGYLFYTLDGSAPTTSSTLYTSPFALTNSATIRVLSLSSDFSQQSEGVPVTVLVIPTYTLQTSIVGNGTLSTNPPGGIYVSNTVVTLTATPALHWSFANWAGDTNGGQISLGLTNLTVTMNGPRNIQAVFVQNAFPLTLTTPGAGTVTANGSIIGASMYYPTDVVVNLSATPSPGWTFIGWQGTVGGTNNPYHLVITQTNVIQGIFGTFATTNSVGGGIVLSLTNPIPYGTSLAVSAVPNPGNYFASWNSGVSGTISPARYSVTVANPAFGAYFSALPAGKYALSAVVSGNGFVSVNPYKTYYNSNDFEQLIATPNAGSYFFGWSGSATGTSTPLAVNVTNNEIIQGNFGVAPGVSISPLSLTVFAGTNATLAANALGVSPLRYQWQNGLGAIAGATNALLVISNIQPASAGGYSVVVSNSFGVVTSGVATITVIGAPSITNQPAPVTVIVGHAASYAVGAYGAPALAYQWQLNGVNLTGATNTTLAVSNAFPLNAGTYMVAVTNLWGSVTSSPAALTVLPLTIAVPAKLVGGKFQITFDTATGINYEVDYSTDLMTWTPWLNLGGNGRPLTLNDPVVAGTPQRFYRVVLSPQ